MFFVARRYVHYVLCAMIIPPPVSLCHSVVMQYVEMLQLFTFINSIVLVLFSQILC